MTAWFLNLMILIIVFAVLMGDLRLKAGETDVVFEFDSILMKCSYS